MTVREILNLIDVKLSQGDHEASLLWDVLTALRGPDHKPFDLKMKAHTCDIRRAAFPKAATLDSLKAISFPAYLSFQPSIEIVPNNDLGDDDDHWLHHLGRARKALKECDIDCDEPVKR
jgi:hypothetical protein